MQPLIPKHIMTLAQIISATKDSIEKFSIEGVTLSGGEPTLQQNLNVLAEKIQSMGLSVILYTGRLFSELPSELIKHVDLVIDGRFQNNNPDYRRKIIGSTNQRIIHVTDRYPDDIWFSEPEIDVVEIDIFDQKMTANGSYFRSEINQQPIIPLIPFSHKFLLADE